MMRVRRLGLGPLQTNCWLVDDGTGGPLAVIDPGGDADVLLEAIGEAPVAWVLLTHGHFDHLGAAGDVIGATGAPLLVHEADAGGITTPAGNGAAIFGFTASAPPADRTLRDGEVLEAGALRFRVIHTPGHTPGGICLFAEDPAGGPPHLFSGDTVFSGSVGRTDMQGGDSRALSRSVARLAALPPETLVHPGHGPDTTIGREIRVNPFFPRA